MIIVDEIVSGIYDYEFKNKLVLDIGGFDYENTDNCFSLQEKHPISVNQMVIKIRDITAVLSESDADVAKIDCEGAEISFINVQKDALQKVEYYMIEVHPPEIKQALTQKFTASSFLLAKDIELSNRVSLLHFKRN